MKGGPGRPRRRGLARSSFGAVLRDLRREAGLTQVALASRAGLHRRVVEWAESTLKTEPRAETIAALERGLGMPGALRCGPCVVCDGPAPVGRRWCLECAPAIARVA